MNPSSYDHNTSFDHDGGDHDHDSNTVRRHMRMMRDMDGFTNFMYHEPDEEEDEEDVEYEYVYEEYEYDPDEPWYLALKDELLFHIEDWAVEIKELWLDAVYFVGAVYQEYQRRRTYSEMLKGKQNPHYKTMIGKNGKFKNVNMLRKKFFRRSKWW